MMIKERHIFIGVVLGTLLFLVLGILIPGDDSKVGTHLPWQIVIDAEGRSQVFGITLGKSSLAELEQRIGEPVVISLFADDSGKRVIEGYFDIVTLGGLNAKMVAVVQLDEAEMKAIYERGSRIATTGSGMRKVTLASEDRPRVLRAVVAGLTYLPRSRLTPEMVAARFGAPAERIREENDGAEHWLYPHLGLGIALHEKDASVLQYVLPDQFERLRKPLLAGGLTVNH